MGHIMKKLYQKNELAFALVCIAGYVLIFGNLRTLGDDSPVTTIGLALASLVLLLFVRTNDLMEKYGLARWATNSRQMLYFVPLWVVASGNLWGGFTPHYQGFGLVCAMISFALVGLIEELLFRGFLFKAMLENGSTKTAIAISAITFGMGHIVNLLTGHELVETLVQVAFAVAIGFIFTMVYYKCNSLLPLIVTHSVIDVFSVFAGDDATTGMLFVGITIAMAILYCGYLARLDAPA